MFSSVRAWHFMEKALFEKTLESELTSWTKNISQFNTKRVFFVCLPFLFFWQKEIFGQIHFVSDLFSRFFCSCAFFSWTFSTIYSLVFGNFFPLDLCAHCYTQKLSKKKKNKRKMKTKSNQTTKRIMFLFVNLL